MFFLRPGYEPDMYQTLRPPYQALCLPFKTEILRQLQLARIDATPSRIFFDKGVLRIKPHIEEKG